MTDPAHASVLPASYQRAISRRGNFLIYSSDRTGTRQAFRMDLKTGESRQLTDAQALDGASLTLLPDDRGCCFFDDRSVRQLNFSTLRDREIYSIPEGFSRCPGFHISEDGLYAAFGERKGDSSRLRLVPIAKGAAATVVEQPWILLEPTTRPRRTQILYRKENGGLWLVNFDGQQSRPLKVDPGLTGPARWSPSGRTVVYLHFPDDLTQLITLREHTPDENADKLVAKTSQFAHFGCNGDSSVFVGASRNKSSPYVLLLLRVTRRELTLCEHRASDPAAVAPVFSPNSQNVFFQSDRHGKPAIYRVRVEKFVEETSDSL